MIILNLLCVAVLSIYGLWVLYVFTMNIRRAEVAGRLRPVARALALPWCLLAILLDLVLNHTLFAVLLLDFPRKGENMFSLRLERLIRYDNWQGRTAKWIAHNLLDDFDHTWTHIR